ncbi:MAG: hypothetical protein LAO21_15285 [Acidobacteriia bacterium]|nr:hypothetical protein [Terriglobia bacterium]
MRPDRQNKPEPKGMGRFKQQTIAGMVIAIALLIASPLSQAQTLSLNVNPSSISFADQNPTNFPSISASAIVQVQVTASWGNGTWSVTSLAGGDLLNSDGRSVIPISNMRWTASRASGSCSGGCTCMGGTASKSSPQHILNGSGYTGFLGFGSYTCNVNFTLVNDWSYNTGSYSQSLTVTAANP